MGGRDKTEKVILFCCFFLMEIRVVARQLANCSEWPQVFMFGLYRFPSSAYTLFLHTHKPYQDYAPQWQLETFSAMLLYDFFSHPFSQPTALPPTGMS